MSADKTSAERPGSIPDLLARIRNGDEEAARELLTRYESKVRLVVRRQLPRLLQVAVRLARLPPERLGQLLPQDPDRAERLEGRAEPDRVPGLGRAEQGDR